VDAVGSSKVPEYKGSGVSFITTNFVISLDLVSCGWAFDNSYKYYARYLNIFEDEKADYSAYRRVTDKNDLSISPYDFNNVQ
jgi:hypothetical protein